MRKINYPILALIVANIIWGATSPILKFSLQNIPPLSLAFVRFLLASLILYPFVHKKIDYPDLKNKWLWIYALSGVSFNIIFFFWALQRTASINAPIIASAGPVLVMIGSIVFLREKVKLSAIIGTLISLVGVGFIVFQPLLEKGLNPEILGNLFIILATLGAVVSTIVGRKFLTPHNSFGSTFWACLIGAISFLPFMIFEFVQSPTWIASLDIRGWVGILYGAIFSSAIAYSLSAFALAKLPATRVSVFAYLDPVVAILVAIPLLGERMTTPFIFGSFMIFVGILISEHRVHYHPLHKLFSKSSLVSAAHPESILDKPE